MVSQKDHGTSKALSHSGPHRTKTRRKPTIGATAQGPTTDDEMLVMPKSKRPQNDPSSCRETNVTFRFRLFLGYVGGKQVKNDWTKMKKTYKNTTSGFRVCTFLQKHIVHRPFFGCSLCSWLPRLPERGLKVRRFRSWKRCENYQMI